MPQTYNALAGQRELQAEIEQLQDALADCASALRYVRAVYGDLYGVGWDRALGKAKAALRQEGDDGS